MKLKDLLKIIRTYTKIQLSNYDGETFFPNYSDLDEYKEYFITDIHGTDKGVLSIGINPME